MWIVILKHWRWIVTALFIALAVVWWRVDRAGQYKAGHAAATATISAELAEATQKQVEQAHQISVEYQTAKAETEIKERIRYVEVQKIVEKPVYHNMCLDDGGLQLINEAVSDAN